MKKFYILTMALALCTSAFAAVPELESETKSDVIKNSTFAGSSYEGWNTIGDGWTFKGENNDQPWGGRVYARIGGGNSLDSGDTGISVTQTITLAEKGTYALSAYVRACDNQRRNNSSRGHELTENEYALLFVSTEDGIPSDIDGLNCAKVRTDGWDWATATVYIAVTEENTQVTIGYGLPKNMTIANGIIECSAFELKHFSSTADVYAVKACLEQTDYTMVESVTVSETEKTVTDKEPFRLTATISPENFSSANKGVTWSTTNKIVATVSEDGEVTPVGAGTCDIIATSNADALVYGKCELTVKVAKVDVEGVSVSVPADGEAKVEVRKTLQLTATVSPYNATDQRVTWSSEDDGIATVDAEGVVTGVKKGKVEITATSQENEEIKGKIEVEVFAIDVESVTMSQTEEKMVVGGTFTLTATVAPDNASEPEITWSVEGDAVEIAEADGVVTVTAVKTGKATVKATAGEETATCEIEVVEPVSITSESENLGNPVFSDGKWTATDAYKTPKNEPEVKVSIITWDISRGYARFTSGGEDASYRNLFLQSEVQGKDAGIYVLTAGVSVARDAWRGTVSDGSGCIFVTDNPENACVLNKPGNTSLGTLGMTENSGGNDLQPVKAMLSAKDEVSTLYVGFGIPAESSVNKPSISCGNFNLTYYKTLDEDAVNAFLDKKPYTMVKEIKLDKSYTMTGGDVKEVLTATVEPDDATNQGIIWSSSDPETVKVEEDGTIIGLKKGDADITATSAADGLIFAVCNVKVDQITGVDEIVSAPADVKVYDVAGRYVGSDVNNLTKGIYIIREGNSAKKVNLK